VQEFTVRAVDMYVTNITVRLVPTEDDPAWLMDNIKVGGGTEGGQNRRVNKPAGLSCNAVL
jgi:hypothetical protein